jgi:hypothetical protein
VKFKIGVIWEGTGWCSRKRRFRLEAYNDQRNSKVMITERKTYYLNKKLLGKSWALDQPLVDFQKLTIIWENTVCQFQMYKYHHSNSPNSFSEQFFSFAVES